MRAFILAALVAGLATLMVPHAATAQDAKGDRNLATKRAEAEYLKARLANVEAEIALIEYRQNTFPKNLESTKNDIIRAKQDLEVKKEALELTKKKFSTGEVSEERLTQDKINYERALIALENNKTKLDVLLKYTRDKSLKELTAEAEKTLAEVLAKKGAFERARDQQDEQ
jgi:hypothetical protein